MAEYISREAANKVKLAFYKKYDEDGLYERKLTLVEVGGALSKIPAADVVEVVRCKDCKHYWKNSKYKSNMEDMEDVAMCLASPSDDAFCSEGEDGTCLKIYDDGNFSTDAIQERSPTDFCSYGERKQEVQRER